MHAIILQKLRQSQVVSIKKWRKSVIFLGPVFFEEIDGFSRLFFIYFALSFIVFGRFPA